MDVVERLIGGLRLDGRVVDVRIGALWTVVAVETERGLRAGLASTQTAHVLEHGRPLVREAGDLLAKRAGDLARLALPGSGATLTERSLGFAALNALMEIDIAACAERNAEEIIVERGTGRNVAIVGHFPFVSRVRAVAGACWVLELEPQAGDLPAARAPDVLPKADVVAITGQTLVNCTFEGLVALCRPEAYVVVLGPTTPLSRVLFDYGVDAVSGTVVVDVAAVLLAASQGANFRQMPGRRLLTILADR
jgi:uncharacterized protein (DUF4213/DUF364 family)